MKIAQIYNQHTGAQVTHFDVATWGWRDQALIIHALTFLSKS